MISDTRSHPSMSKLQLLVLYSPSGDDTRIRMIYETFLKSYIPGFVHHRLPIERKAEA